MSSQQRRDEVERRLLAIMRDEMDLLDEDFPDGWAIEDFVITGRLYVAPDTPRPVDAWEGGPHLGWNVAGFTRGTSSASWYDVQLLEDSLRVTERRRDRRINTADNVQPSDEEQPAEDDEEGA